MPGRASAVAVRARQRQQCSKEQWEVEDKQDKEVVQGCCNVEGMEAWQLRRC